MPPGRRTQPSGRLLPRAQLRHRFFGDVLRGLRGVDHAEAPRLGGGACAIGGAHAFEELVAPALDPVRTVRPGCKVAAPGALPAAGPVHVPPPGPDTKKAGEG